MFLAFGLFSGLILEVIAKMWRVDRGYVVGRSTIYLFINKLTSISITCLYVRRSVTTNRRMCRSGLITLYGICSGFNLSSFSYPPRAIDTTSY